MFKKIVLKNGLRVITLPMKNTQALTLLILVGTGSKYETKETNGISHFLEHMCFKGTKKRPSLSAVAETLDRVGGIYNAFTGQDYTGYFAKVESSQFELAMDWVSDVYLNAILPEEEVEKEKRVVIEEINMIKDDPMSYVGVLWPKLLYGNQPAGWDIAGAKENIMRLNLEKLLNYRTKQYVPSNTVFCAAGNVSTKKVQNIIRQYFAGAGKGKSMKKEKVIDKQKKPQCLLETRETDQTHLWLGVRGYNSFHPFRYTQGLLGVILGGMMSSRLFLEIRDRLGIAYYVRTEAEENPDTGFLVTQVGVDTQKVEKAISVILKEYRAISEKKVSKEELKKAKDNIKGRIALLLESSDAQASFYGLQELLEKRVSTLREIYRKIDKIKAEDILKVARNIFQPRKLNLALIGPFKDKNKFEKLLKL